MNNIKKILNITFCALLMSLGSSAQKMTLEQCLESAAKYNADLKNARLDISMAEEDKASAYTNYFPQISAMGLGFIGAKNLMRSTMEMPGMDLSAFGIPPMGNMSYEISMIKKGVIANITALQPIYMGGQIVNGNKLAEIQQEIRQLQLEMTEKDIYQNVQNYFWQLQGLRGNITTLDAVDKQLAEVHRLTENFVKAGVINRNDLLRVELKQQEMKSQRLSLNNGIELLRMLLAQLVGADYKNFDVVDSSILNPLSPESYFISTENALVQREEVELTSKSVQVNELQVKMKRGKNLPSITVGASGMYMNIMNENQGNLVGLATISIPISNWWAGSHEIKKAKMAVEQSRNTMQEVYKKLHIDVMNSWNQLNEAYAQIEIARKSVSQADENMRLNNDQYRVGTIGMTDLLDAVTLYTQAHNALVTSCATYQNKLADYIRKTR